MKWPHHGDDDDDDAMAARTKLKFGSQILTFAKKCGQKHDQIKQEIMQNTKRRQKRSATSLGGSSVQDCRRVGL